MIESTITIAYGRVAKGFHWVVALLLVAQWVIAWFMPHVGRGTVPTGWVGAHVSVGILIIFAVAARILWRWSHSPVVVRGSRTVSQRLAGVMFVLMYALMVVVPVLGWANANSRGWVVGVTQMFAPGGDQVDLRLPALLDKGSSLGHQMGDVHGLLAWVLLGLAVLHVAVGVYHEIVLKDGTLERMR